MIITILIHTIGRPPFENILAIDACVCRPYVEIEKCLGRERTLADKHTRIATLADKDARATTLADKDPRLTLTTMKVLSVFCEDPKAEMSGREIGKKTKLPSGTVYPILIRLERVGWLKSRWEDIDPKKEGRPRRRFYKIKALGYQKTQDALREMNQSFGVASWIS